MTTEIITRDERDELDRVSHEATLLLGEAYSISTVIDAPSEITAAEFLKQIKTRHSIAEDARTKLVKPLNDHVKMINAEFKKTTQPLEQAEALVKKGMIAYRNSPEFLDAERSRLEIEREARQAIREGDSPRLTELADEHAAASAAAPKKVETATGEARFRKTLKWELIDLEVLPAGYWTPDEKKIAAAVKAGMAIPGVKTWTEAVPIIV